MRIVSLCPSLTELVFDLGRGSDLIGITDYCAHPRPQVDALEKLGGTKSPRVERIVELAPDIVLLNEEENRLADAEALARAGLRCHASFPKDVRGTAEMVRSIGAALDRPQPAERIASEIEARAARVRSAAQGARVLSFAYVIWRKPWMSCNGDTFASELLCLPGARNVFAAESERYPEISPARLGAADPELVLLCSEPFPFQEEHAHELAGASRLPRARFRIADGEYLSWHGSRTPAGIDYAESLIASARASIPAG
jgi:ABC-type Fe3+-hydroxamate transport system substrate-binding protein